MLCGRQLEVVGCAQNIARLFERILNFASIEERSSRGILSFNQHAHVIDREERDLPCSRIHYLDGPSGTYDNRRPRCCKYAQAFQCQLTWNGI